MQESDRVFFKVMQRHRVTLTGLIDQINPLPEKSWPLRLLQNSAARIGKDQRGRPHYTNCKVSAGLRFPVTKISFSYCAPCLWSSLPDDLVAAQTVEIFKSKRKTFLFIVFYFHSFTDIFSLHFFCLPVYSSVIIFMPLFSSKSVGSASLSSDLRYIWIVQTNLPPFSFSESLSNQYHSMKERWIWLCLKKNKYKWNYSET